MLIRRVAVLFQGEKNMNLNKSQGTNTDGKSGNCVVCTSLTQTSMTKNCHGIVLPVI